ncbi:MAG: hypothetical protein ACI361_00645 [Atopobiaceae bacterium]
MLGPAELFVMLWIFGMFALAILAVFAVRRLFQKRENKDEKKDSESRK